jgi:hypothetical protein
MKGSYSFQSVLTVVLRLVGTGALIILGMWMFAALRNPSPNGFPAVLPLGSAFDDNPQIPVEEFKTKFHAGEALIKKHQSLSERYDFGHSLVEWISFGLTAIITITAGFLGRLSPADKDPVGTARALIAEAEKGNTPGKPGNAKRSVALLGVLGALVSVCIGLSTKLNTETSVHRQAALDLTSTLASARRDWYSGKTKEDAARVIEKLDTELVKHP